MSRTVLLGLLLNAGLLLALTVVVDLLSVRSRVGRTWTGHGLAGVSAGLIGIGLMAVPIHVEPGVQFDARSVLLSVTGLFLGPFATIVAVVLTAAFRVWLGGAWPIGVLIILASGALGLFWRTRMSRLTARRPGLSLYSLGLAVHIVMLSLIALIPDGAGLRALPEVLLPVIVLFPLATVALGLLVIQRNEREAAEARQRWQNSERERLIAAVEQSDESILMTDTAGTIEYVNPAFERVSGYRREEVIGQNPRILKSAEQDPAAYEALWRTLLAGGVWRGRLINRRKDGTLFTEDATISPVRDAEGRVASFVAVKRDVTRDLELQAQYLQAQKMEGVGQLAAGVAHDFNNLLTVITGSAELATRMLPPDSPAIHDLEQILAAGTRAGALTRQLLTFSRRSVSLPAVVGVDSVVNGLRTMLARLVQDHAALELDLERSAPKVRVDPGQFEQVIMNLSINARDAMSSGGTLRIETAVADLDHAEASTLRPAVSAGRYARVSVIDTGDGMDAATLARIFEPFFTTKDIGKGTGLGLPTVLQIVERSGGGLRVTSAPGAGTRFDVFLPEASGTDGATGVAQGTTARSRRTGPVSVLVVEDEDWLRDLAVRVLRAEGFLVTAAANGRDGLAMAEDFVGPLDLVITDLVMPEMGGRELAVALAGARPGVPVLYTSGYTSDPSLAQWVRASGAAFLAKPYSPEELVNAASALIAQTWSND